MRNGLQPQPARLVRGNSRRIMSMRFRPANIRVINSRASSCAVIGPAVQREMLQAHQRERVPATPPVEDTRRRQNGARRQGSASPRQTAGVPLPAPRRSGQTMVATGGSGGNTSQQLPKRNRPAPSLRRRAGLIKKNRPQSSEGLTGSLHIRTSTAEPTEVFSDPRPP